MDPARWQQIERLYQMALTRPAAERAAYLAEACAGDEALRHRALVMELVEGETLTERIARSSVASRTGRSTFVSRRSWVPRFPACAIITPWTASST